MQTMRAILRSHEEGLEGRQFSRHSLKSVCMHGGFLFGDQTTGSFIAEINRTRATYLLTGGSIPCLALYKPYWLVAGETFSFGEEQQQEALEFWKKRERLHRAVIENRVSDLEGYLAKRNSVEAEVDAALKALDPATAGEEELTAIVDRFLQAEEDLLTAVLSRVEIEARPPRIGGNLYFRYYWQKQNRQLLSGGRGC